MRMLQTADAGPHAASPRNANPDSGAQEPRAVVARRRNKWRDPATAEGETALLQLRCPVCALAVTPRVHWLTIEHCPRCIARLQIAVKMQTSTVTVEGRQRIRSLNASGCRTNRTLG